MKTVATLTGLVLLFTLYAWISKSNRLGSSSDSLDYQGQTIKLSKPYATFEDYKDDPNNLAPSDVKKTQELVKAAPIAQHFSNRAEMVDAIFKLKFPGYGMGSHGESKQTDGSVLALFDVEIPQSDDFRHLLFRGSDDGYTLVDDFVDSKPSMNAATIQADGTIVYSDRSGKEVLRRTRSVK